MNGATARRVVRLSGGEGRVALLLIVLAATGFMPYCYHATYADYRFRLTAAVPPGFALPDSARDGQWTLTADDSTRWRRCGTLKPYTLQLHRSGYNDIGMSGVYIGLDSGAPPMLHVVMNFDSAHAPQLDEWALRIVRLATQMSSVKPIAPPDSSTVLGKLAQFKEWCARLAPPG